MVNGGAAPDVPSCNIGFVQGQFLAVLPVREDRHALCWFSADDRMIGLELNHLVFDGCIT